MRERSPDCFAVFKLGENSRRLFPLATLDQRC